MRKVFLLFCFVAFILLSSTLAWPGVRLTMEITDFPLGIGNSVPQSFIEKHGATFQWLADTLNQDPDLILILIPWADATRYSKHHDPLNAATALSRALFIKRILVEKYGVDETRIVFTDARESSQKGPKERKVEIRLFHIPDGVNKKDLEDIVNKMNKSLQDLKDSLACNPPVTTENQTFISQLISGATFGIGGGYATNYFGGLPTVNASVGWRQIAVEAELGINPWSSKKYYVGEKLDTHNKLIAGHLVFYLTKDRKLSLLGGWERNELWVKDYDGYPDKFEGPVLGAKVRLWDIISVTGFWTPGYRGKIVGVDNFQVTDHNDQFRVSVGITKIFGGDEE